MNTCLNCGAETTNPKFCSKSCSASFTNKTTPKRSPKVKICPKCNSRFTGRSKHCKACQQKPISENDMTISEAIYTKHHKSSAFALIRWRARQIAQPKGKSCSNCGYDKHVEVCHIKPISNFPIETLVSVVNSKSNLALLCPNCHWEFDHGLLESPVGL